MERLDLLSLILVLSSSAAKLTISRGEATRVPHGWYVDYEVVQCRATEEIVRGRRHFTDQELAAAFNLTPSVGKHGKQLLERYGGDSAEQGKYIRYREYLNIPCPGTSHDGDPNISVHLDDQILQAVTQLLVRTDYAFSAG